MVLVDGVRLPAPFLDIRARLMPLFSGGLLALAFHPDYANNGLFFVHYTDLAGDVVVSRFRRLAADPNQADANSEAVLLSLPQPTSIHNGGGMAFGDDGFLYVGLGDGGLQGDPLGLARDLGQLYGKILRLDVDHPSGGLEYSAPASNPFIGVPGARPEIWARGLRNPWRIAFDRETADLWIADVGWRDFEEVNFQPAASPGGEDYGWNVMEGSACRTPPVGCNMTGLTLPIYDYAHVYWGLVLRCAVIGGTVYRGRDMVTLQGRYFFSDNCSDEMISLAQQGGSLSSERVHFRIPATGGVPCGVVSFGEDHAGEVYFICAPSGTAFRLIPGGLRLMAPELVAGMTESLELAGGQPLTDVALAGSLQGLGNHAIVGWQVSLSLASPRLIGLGRSDAVGSASFSFQVPWVLSGRGFWIQAAQPNLVSNVVFREVQ